MDIIKTAEGIDIRDLRKLVYKFAARTVAQHMNREQLERYVDKWHLLEHAAGRIVDWQLTAGDIAAAHDAATAEGLQRTLEAKRVAEGLNAEELSQYDPYANIDPYEGEYPADRPLYHTTPQGYDGSHAALFPNADADRPVSLSVVDIDGDFRMTHLSRTDAKALALALIRALGEG